MRELEKRAVRIPGVEVWFWVVCLESERLDEEEHRMMHIIGPATENIRDEGRKVKNEGTREKTRRKCPRRSNHRIRRTK